MSVTCGCVIKIMEKLAPISLALDWDNVGLQMGSPNEKVRKILVTLDITTDVVDEAVEMGADMIVAHHPLIFKPLDRIRSDTHIGSNLSKLVKNDIQVYVAHTNLDRSAEGVSHHLAKALGLNNLEVLDAGGPKLYKIVVFVPKGYEDSIRDAMGKAGAGWIGNYSHCTYQVAGTGTFKPLAGADPFIGSTGELEKVEEYRLETIVPQHFKKQVLKAMMEAHPYEEVAHDIYPLGNKQWNTGLGILGYLGAPMTLEDFANKVKDELDIGYLKIVGLPQEQVQKVAVCGGSGGNLISLAKDCGAHVYLTGDVGYHEALDAREMGLNIVDAGHNATEKLIIPALKHYLREELRGEDVIINTSKIDTNPWDTI
ncbi:MAG: Nif3-like dinuclear metal center hexameric protein [Clostridia bacterium]|nr:Nif3-like dinuclear metal center hexameric protein [Clostridia bacterium]